MKQKFRTSLWLLIGCVLATMFFLEGCKKNSTTQPPNNESHSLKSPTLLLQATSNTGTYKIRWTKPIGAISYQLEEDDTSSFTNPEVAFFGHDTVTTIPNKPTGKTFYYRVRAIKDSDTSVWSTPRSISIVQMIIGDSYYPLQLGNMWQYECYATAGGGTNGPWYVTVSVTKDTILNNMTYSLLESNGTLLGLPVRRFARFDSTSGNYYEYNLAQNFEYLVDSTRCTTSATLYWGTLSIVNNYALLGAVTTTRRFYRGYNPSFEDRYFARGFGYVRLYSVGFRSTHSERLVYAIIAGYDYGSPAY